MLQCIYGLSLSLHRSRHSQTKAYSRLASLSRLLLHNAQFQIIHCLSQVFSGTWMVHVVTGKNSEQLTSKANFSDFLNSVPCLLKLLYLPEPPAQCKYGNLFHRWSCWDPHTLHAACYCVLRENSCSLFRSMSLSEAEGREDNVKPHL